MSPPSPVADAIDAVESRFDVTVLAARDVGSRAWNLADADSDYDAGVVFRQPAAAYATLGGYRAAVDFDGEDAPEVGDARVDVGGWNVRQFAELVVDSNPSAFEFLHSPVRYRDSAALDALAADVGEAFDPLSLYHHYRSLATSSYEEHVRAGDAGATVTRNLYVARAGLYARYVRDERAFPDLDFPAFLDRAHGFADVDDATRDRVRALVARKRRGEGEARVGDAIGSELAHPPADLDPDEYARPGPDTAQVNAFVRAAFRET